MTSSVTFNTTAGTASAIQARTPLWTAGKVYAVGDVVTNAVGDRVRCVTAHTASASFTDDLPKWKPNDAAPGENLRINRARYSKSGGIGVGDKGVIALRFDDYHTAFISTMLPLLTARGLPAGFASISRLSTQPWSSANTLADVVTFNKQGIEIWCHGTDHKDPSPNGLTGTNGLYDQIVTAKAELEAAGLKVQGWMQPGATQLGTPIPYGTAFQAWDDLEGYAYHLIRKTYPLSESYVTSIARPIPTGLYHGLDHITASDGMTLAAAKAKVDDAVTYRTGLCIMCHTGNLGLASMTTLADYTALLDYVLAKWDAGLIDVLTPSGLMFADKTTNRLDLLRGGDMEGGATDWALVNGATFDTTTPHSGTQTMRIPNSTTSLMTTKWRPTDLKKRSYDGEAFLFEGWARSNGAATTTSRFFVSSYTDTTPLNLILTKSGITTTWTKVRHAFTIPVGVNEINIGLGRNAGDGIDWDDCHVWKV